MKVLIVDDEEVIVESLMPVLTGQGHDVISAGNAARALEAVARGGIDLVLLDLGLPDIDGIEIIAKIKELSDAAIVILSARHLEADKVRALDEGSDDYVNKPFGIGELLARIRAVERRRAARTGELASTFESRELSVNFATREVVRLGEKVRLSPKEFALLETLCRHAGQVVTQRRLMVAGWNDPQADNQYLRSYMSLLRQKLEYDPSEPELVLTEPGVGYRLSVTPLD